MVSVHLGVLTEEEKQARDIERRRRNEAERLKRVMSPKQLKMGLDVAALQQQVQQQQERELLLRLKDAHAEQQLLYSSAVTELQQLERAQQQQQLLLQLQHFNQTAARKRQIKEEFAAEAERSFDAEANRRAAGPSSLLLFEGEDENFKLRQQQQQQQQKQLLQEHLFQRELLLLQQRDRDRSYEDFAERSSKVQEALVQQKLKEDAQQRLDTAQTNLQIAEQRRQREEAMKEAERECERREIDMKLHGPFLTEGRRDLMEGDSSLSPWLPRVPTGSLGRNRDGFKGYPLETLKAAEDENKEKRKEMKREEERQRFKEFQWASFAESQRCLGVFLEQERERQRRLAAESLASQNQKMSKEQKERENFRNKELYRTPVGEEYNNYFSRSSR